MVSEDPQDGRCNASVTDKVGLVIEDDVIGEMFTTGEEEDELQSQDEAEDDCYDGVIVEVVLEKGAVTVHKEPEYQDVYSYLDEGFNVTAIKLRPYDADESDDPVHISIEDDDPYVMHHHTEHVGFCERYPVKSKDADTCPVHGGNNPGAPEGNSYAVTHGLKAKRSNYYRNVMTDEDRIIVEEFVDNWLDLSSYTRDDTAVLNELYRIAVDQIRLWNAQDEFDEGMVYEQVVGQDDSGEPVIVDEENPANLPYDRLDRTTFKKLKELGVLDDPDSQQAEATESLAQKFAELGND